MTAPAVAESAPVEFETAEQGMDAIASEAIKATLAANPDTSEEAEAAARDEKGRFAKAKPDGEADPLADIAAAQGTSAEPTEGAEPEPVVLPEGFVAVPKIEGRELATQFTVLDKDGELEVPDMLIKYNANGKERTYPLDKVVKMAQFGEYNHEREQRVQQSQQEVQQTNTKLQQLLDYARSLEGDRDRLLSDDEHYLITRAKHEQENTPEARLKKEQEKNQQNQNQQAFQQASREGEQFFSSELTPTVETITKALPTVSTEEIAAKVLLISNQFLVHTPFGSILPPKYYPAVRKAIAEEVVPWAQQLHAHRDGERQTTTRQTAAEKQALQQAAEKARIESQRAKNLVGKGVKPGAGKAAADTPPKKVIRTVDDAMESAISDSLKAVGVG